MTDAQAIRRRQQTGNVLQALTLIVLLVAVVWQFGFINPENADTRTALCALRADLQQRVEQTQSFLRHPEDFPQFNDPKVIALTQAQVDGQQRTVVALSILSCN